MSKDKKIIPKRGPTLPCVGYEDMSEPPTEFQYFMRGCGARVLNMAPADFDREDKNASHYKERNKKKGKKND